MKYQVLVSLKNNEKVFINVVIGTLRVNLVSILLICFPFFWPVIVIDQNLLIICPKVFY